MAIRTKLLNGNNITRDTDFSKFIQTVSEPGVIEGFTVTANSVAVGQARVPCERTNGETLYALIYNTAPVSISGDGEVYILVNQTYIDDGELANEDGTGIATIVVGTTPSKNALKIATITGGVVTDNRNIIPKVGELKTYIQSLQTRMNTVEQEIDELIADSAVDHLEETGLVGELYALTDTLFKQKTPEIDSCSIDCNIGDIADNTQIHIQRIASGVASNKLKLKVKKIGAPTTGLVVEVRRGVQVTVTENAEAYWYGNELVCSGSIGYSGITTSYQEFEITMNGQFGGTKGELLDIVVYQTGNIVNSTNYYSIGCDSTQYSQAFSYVKVNGTTRTRSNLCPYCVGSGFMPSLICKTGNAREYQKYVASVSDQSSNTQTFTVSEAQGELYIKIYGTVTPGHKPSGSSVSSSAGIRATISVNGTQVYQQSLNTYADAGTQIVNRMAKLENVPANATITLFTNAWGDWYSSSSPETTGTLTYTVPGNTLVIIRKLIPQEIKEIGQQTSATSYGNIDGQRYGEFDGEIHSSATTGAITPGNCVGFKVIVDSSGNRYKIPVYGM